MKKYDLIYFSGDSWTWALNTDGVLVKPIEEYESFPYIVANKLGAPYVKNAMGGAGNNWIHRTVYNDLPNLRKQYDNILSIVGWSNPVRTEILCRNIGRIHNISSPPFSEDFFKNYMEESCDLESDEYVNYTEILIKSVRSLYKSLGINYIDAFAFTDVINVNFLGSSNTLEKTFLDICGFEGRIYNPSSNGYGHQNVLGNSKIADAIVNAVETYYN